MKAALIPAHPHEEAILTQALRCLSLEIIAYRAVDELVAAWAEAPCELIVVARRATEPLAAVRALRGVAVVPLVLIVDSLTERVHLELLEAGADRVIERPHSASLLVGYAQALLRRGGGVLRHALPALEAHGLRLEPEARAVRIDGGPTHRLTQLEFRLLHTLMVHQGQLFPPDRLVELVWGYNEVGDSELLRGLVRRLRAKIEPDPRAPRFITNVHGHGYAFGET